MADIGQALHPSQAGICILDLFTKALRSAYRKWWRKTFTKVERIGDIYHDFPIKQLFPNAFGGIHCSHTAENQQIISFFSGFPEANSLSERDPVLISEK